MNQQGAGKTPRPRQVIKLPVHLIKLKTMKAKIIAPLAGSVVSIFAILTLHYWLDVTFLKALSIYAACALISAVSKGVEAGVQKYIDSGEDQ